MAFGVQLAAYRFDKYRTTEKSEKKPSILVTRIISVAPDAGRAAFQKVSPLADAIYFCRDQVSEPANVLYPAEFARRIRSLDLPGMEVEVLGEDAMRQLGMNALLGVGQGSSRAEPAGRHAVEWRER